MLNWEEIILKWYSPQNSDYQLLIAHSQQVADMAVELSLRYNETHGEVMDVDFVREAAMLHDIGMCRTYAPGIFCNGTLPYLRHGLEGYEMLMSLNLPRHARVCAHHTGSGLTAQEIIDQNLPLPHIDLLPETLEEKVICYADSFFSKSKIAPAKTVQQVRQSLEKFGKGTLKRFDALTELFGAE